MKLNICRLFLSESQDVEAVLTVSGVPGVAWEPGGPCRRGVRGGQEARWLVRDGDEVIR